MTRRTVLTMLVLAASAGLAPADTYDLAGSGESLWLIRRHDQKFDLAAKVANPSWRIVARDLQGDLVVTAAVNRNLHVFFRTGRHVIYEMGGEGLPGLSTLNVYRWPEGTPPLTICEAANFHGRRETSPLVVVQRPAGPIPPLPPTNPSDTAPTRLSATGPMTTPSTQATRPRTAPATAGPRAQTAPATGAVAPVLKSADGSPLQMVNLAVYLGHGANWEYLTEVQGVLLAAHHRVLSVIVNGTLYVLVAQGRDSQLLTWQDVQGWRRIPLPDSILNSQILEAINIHGRLTLVAAERPAASASTLPAGAEAEAPAASQPATLPALATAPAAPEPVEDLRALRVVRLYTLAVGDASFSHQTIRLLGQPKTRLLGQPLTWPEDSPPMVAVLAQQAVLVWKDGKRLHSASCDLTGEVPAVLDIDVFQQVPYGDGLAVLSFLRYTLLAAVFLMMFFLRPRTLPKPFTLPKELMPSPLGTRLLAAILDFAPFTLLGGAISVVLLPSVTEQEFKQLLAEVMNEQAVPQAVAWAFVASMLSYLAYCILMEFYFGATLGKMLFRLRVVGDEGRKPEIREVAMRNLMKVFALSFTYFLLAMYGLFILVTRNRQGLGDMVARTTVVIPRPPRLEAEEPPELDDYE